MKTGVNQLKFAACVVSLALAPLAGSRSSAAGTTPAEAGFSFDVYGDSQSMMYVPYKANQEAEARQVTVDMFQLVLPARVLRGMVNKSGQLTYDTATKELVLVVMPFSAASDGI